jgi:hypothetical protein
MVIRLNAGQYPHPRSVDRAGDQQDLVDRELAFAVEFG